MTANLADLLDAAAAAHAARPALVHEGVRTSYAELAALAAQFAGLLRAHGVGLGDRVALLLPNVPAYPAAYYGALRLGAIVVPLNPLLKTAEIEQRLAHSGACALLTLEERAGELRGPAERHGVVLLDTAEAAGAEPVSACAERAAGDVAVLLYTSGTTGDAKGAELTHGGLRWNAAACAGALLRLTPQDVLLGAAPLSHIFGQSACMNAAIAAGACVALVPRFEAVSALALMHETSTTVFLGVPTMCIGLLQAAEATEAAALPPLRVTHSGGASLAVETLNAFVARFGCPLLEGYGLTETGGTVTTHRFGRPCKAGSVGTAVEGVELGIVGDGTGEVLVRSPGLMRGYRQNPAATAAAIDGDGWFATGDVGRLDEDGYLFLVDRKTDTILRGGYSVYPRELEEVVYQHPAVLEAAVVGVPDPLLGEEVVALVVLRPDATEGPEAVQAFVRARVAAYKYPRLVVAVAALPRGPSGKILKRAIDRGELRQALDATAAGVGRPADNG